MSDTCDLCLLGLIFLSSLLTGISGVGDHVFISSGENVRLLCNNALQGCTSTTWIYDRFRHSAAVELINLGIKKKDTESHERLSLGSDCSLNINNITKEDHGLYTCQQWTVNGQKQGPDARVYLHVLHVSSSSSQTEISSDSVTLFCQLYSYSYSARVSCDDWIRSQRIELFWVNQAGVKLKRSDSRYQILSSSDHCLISLSTTLLNEDLNREWRCAVTHRNQVKSSATYTVKRSDQAKTTAVTPGHFTNSQDPSTTDNHITKVISVSAAACAVIFLAVLWLIFRKRADNERGTDQSSVKDENEHKGTYETIDVSIPPTARDDGQTDGVTYSEVSSSGKKPVKSLSDHNDTVTYAAIR